MNVAGVLISLAVCLGVTLGQGFGGRHGGIRDDPASIRRILGSTVIGRELRMGEMGLPRHGGAGRGERYADGTADGWDGNPHTLRNRHHGWSDPFQGAHIPQVPIGFGGDFGSLGGVFSRFGGHFLFKMKQFLQSSILLAVVAAVLAQGYIGRQRNGHYVEPFGNGLSSLGGGGMGNMPEHIQRIIGSTVTGEQLVGGMNGLPRHGGTLNENGLVDGWGMNPDEPASPAVSLWSDPLNGAGFPTNYNGEELVFDRVSNRYVANGHGTGHQGASNTIGDQNGFLDGLHGAFPGEFNGGFQGQGGFTQDPRHNFNKFGQLDYGRRTMG